VIDSSRCASPAILAEEPYRFLAESIPHCVWMTRADGYAEYVNRHWFEYTGVAASELFGSGWLQLVHPDDRDRARTVWENALASGDLYSVEYRLRRSDGVYRWHLAQGLPVRDGQGHIVKWLGTCTDIDAQKRAEEELRLRDRALQAVSQGILITDPRQPDNPIIFASPSFENLTGYKVEEAIGRNCRFLQGADTNAETVAEMREAIRAGQPCTVELLNYRKDGASFWNSLSISPVHGEDGTVTHFVGTQADVSERRRMEEQLRQAQKMEAVGQLAGGVAHDFNNLLTVINGYGELLLGQLDAANPLRELVAEMTKAGERAAALTRQLLAFSRKQVLTPTVLDLNAVVIDMEKMLRRVLGEDIRLVASLSPHLGRVKVDRGQMEQVILNLAVNARDAMPRGGQLSLHTRNVELDENYTRTHSYTRPGSYIALAVADSGHGMTPEVKARLFEPFFTTKVPGKGTGLGLATVYGIVKQSGGSIEVFSQPNAGTTFEIYLPRIEQAVGPSRSHGNRAAAPRGRETILLVEDEEAVRALSRLVLGQSGYNVLESADAAAALALARQHTEAIHLLVTDVVMPDLGGRELAERLLAFHPEMSVLFVSGYTDDAVVRHGVSEHEVNFLQKPFTPLALANKVREVLDSSTAS
jgi:two-component system cell cycle sensor histidine kinase/response regulator CckA